MTLHLASEILRLIFQQVWNYGMGIFFLDQFKVKLTIFFVSLVAANLHVLTLQTVSIIHIHVNNSYINKV